MSLLRTAVPAALVAVSIHVHSAASQAADFDGSKDLLCAAQMAVDCGRDGVCEQGLPEGLNIPPFISIDMQGKRIRATRPDQSEIDTAFTTKAVESGQLILQGAENGRGWSATIAEKTGRMVVTVSAEDVAFVIFGACTAR